MTSPYALHSLTGMAIIPSIAVLATVVAAVSRAPGRLIGLTALPAGLVILQMLVLMLGGHDNDHTTPAGLSILGLHALNGLAILGVSGLILRRAGLLARQQRRGSSGSPQASGSGNAITETRRFRTPRRTKPTPS